MRRARPGSAYHGIAPLRGPRHPGTQVARGGFPQRAAVVWYQGATAKLPPCHGHPRERQTFSALGPSALSLAFSRCFRKMETRRGIRPSQERTLSTFSANRSRDSRGMDGPRIGGLLLSGIPVVLEIVQQLIGGSHPVADPVQLDRARSEGPVFPGAGKAPDVDRRLDGPGGFEAVDLHDLRKRVAPLAGEVEILPVDEPLGSERPCVELADGRGHGGFRDPRGGRIPC